MLQRLHMLVTRMLKQAYVEKLQISWVEREDVLLFRVYELLRTGNDLCILEEWLLTVHRLLRVKNLDMKN